MPNYRPTVAVDLDATLALYDGWKGVEHIGEPVEGASWFLREIIKMDADPVIHTTRVNPATSGLALERPTGESADQLAARVQEWLDDNCMPHFGLWTGIGKPLAAAYVGDRKVVCRPQEHHAPRDAYALALIEIARLIRGEK
jgi:hypothetical protein